MLRKLNSAGMVLFVASMIVGCVDDAPGTSTAVIVGQPIAQPDAAAPAADAPVAKEDAAHPDDSAIVDDAGGVLGELGSLPILDVFDTPCAAHSSTPVRLYPDSDTVLYLDRLERVASRWVAGGTVAQGFVTFDDAATQVTSAPVRLTRNYNLFATEEARIDLVGTSSEGEILFRQFDEHDQPLVPEVVLAQTVVANLAIAAHQHESLVLWGAQGRLVARHLTSGAPDHPSFVVQENAFGAYLSLTAAASASGFAAVWSADSSDDTTQTSFARFQSFAAPPVVRALILTPTFHRVIKLVPTATGFALLFATGAPSYQMYLALLDTEGQLDSPAIRLQGALFGWDIAAAGDRIVVAAMRSSLEPQLRVFDARLAPQSPWVCLAGPGDVGDMAGVHAEAQGLTAVYGAADGAREVVHIPYESIQNP